MNKQKATAIDKKKWANKQRLPRVDYQVIAFSLYLEQDFYSYIIDQKS